MFVETSAFVALLSNEPEAPEIAFRLETSTQSITSPLVILEATMVLSTKLSILPIQAEREVRFVIENTDIAVVDLTNATASIAIEAFQRYGKGRGSGAGLNMSDCLSYACAKEHLVPLLYVGDDFAKTDLA